MPKVIMTKFYCITDEDGDNPVTAGLLEAACNKRGIQFVPILADLYDFSHPIRLEKGAILYKIPPTIASNTIFKTLLNSGVASIFKDQDIAIAFRGSNSILHQKYGLNVIRTVFNITTNRDLLRSYTEFLGGYPLIVKVMGGSHGVGVIRVDSFESLVSLVDYLSMRQSGDVLLRQYIDYEYHARIIVLNGKVIDSIQYHRLPDDFRSNAGDNLTVEAKKFNSDIEQMAIKSVKVLRSDFGGVDVLIDKNGVGYLAETNIPCYFPRSQKASGIDIAGLLVEHLAAKARVAA